MATTTTGTQDPLQLMKDKQKRGLLDYKWEIRRYLLSVDRLKKRDHPLIREVTSPFLYLEHNRKKIRNDRSLKVICQMCTDINLPLRLVFKTVINWH